MIVFIPFLLKTIYINRAPVSAFIRKHLHHASPPVCPNRNLSFDMLATLADWCINLLIYARSICPHCFLHRLTTPAIFTSLIVHPFPTSTVHSLSLVVRSLLTLKSLLTLFRIIRFNHLIIRQLAPLISRLLKHQVTSFSYQSTSSMSKLNYLQLSVE